MTTRFSCGLGTSLLGALCMNVLLSAAAETPVADAAMQGDRDRVRTLLKQGGDVSAAQGDGMTALHWAATNGDAELASMLLYAGANVRATTRLGGYTPLHLASQAGNASVIEALVKSGASAKTATSTGATALMLASTSGNLDAVELLVDTGEIDAVESASGQTALMFAAALDRADVVRLLIEKGADANVTTKVTDIAPLTSPEEYLQEKLRPARPQTNATSTGKATETTNAASKPDGEAKPENKPEAKPAQTTEPKEPEIPGVTRPFKYNELIGKQGGLTALHFAARQGAAKTVQTLVEGGVDVNQVSTADQTSPLLIATINGHFDVARYLTDHGADPNLASEPGMTPLYAVLNVQWAARMFYPQPRAHLQQTTSYLDLITTLLDHGADPNARLRRKIWYTQYNFDLLRIDEGGATAFWRAAYASDIDAMKMLVARGANPDIPTMKPAGQPRRDDGTREEVKEGFGPPVPVGGPGVPPLLAAAGVGYGEGFAGNAHRFAPTGMLTAVKYLVEELEADVNVVDQDGNTAVHHAASRGDNEMILYLVSKGADVTKVNRKGQTTVDMANGPVQRVEPFPETIKLLEGLGAKNNHKCVSC